MIKVATVGVHDHTENMTRSEEISRNLMSKADPTARHSTRTAKMAPLVLSVSFVNILQASFILYVRTFATSPTRLLLAGRTLQTLRIFLWLTSFQRLHHMPLAGLLDC